MLAVAPRGQLVVCKTSEVRLPTEVLPVGTQTCGSFADQWFKSSSFSDARVASSDRYLERLPVVIMVPASAATETTPTVRTKIATITSSTVNPEFPAWLRA